MFTGIARLFSSNLLLSIAIAIVAFVLFWFYQQPQNIENNTETNLSESRSSNDKEVYISPAGLRYGPDPSVRFETRIDHVMAHTKPDTSKPIHSIFVIKERQALLDLLDEAWGLRGPPERQGGRFGRDVYTIDMQRPIGEKGQMMLRIVTEAGTSDVVTAYPVHGRNR